MLEWGFIASTLCIRMFSIVKAAQSRISVKVKCSAKERNVSLALLVSFPLFFCELSFGLVSFLFPSISIGFDFVLHFTGALGNPRHI